MVVFVFENAKIAGREVRVELERGTCATVRSQRVVGAERPRAGALRCGWTVRECHALKLFSTNGHHEADFASLDATRRPRGRETNLRVRLGGSLFRARAPRRSSRARLFPSHHPGFLRRVARNLLQRDGDVQLARSPTPERQRHDVVVRPRLALRHRPRQRPQPCLLYTSPSPRDS